jgi:hypothetical protein
MEDKSVSYEGKKILKCICCGTPGEATKFASASKYKCVDCKAMNALPNEKILEEILAEVSSKKNVVKQVEDDPNVPDGKKLSKCIDCGKDCYIGKFASHKTALCDDCKGSNGETVEREYGTRLKIDLSKLDMDVLPRLDDMYVSPLIIGNPRLRSVECPACGKIMKIVKIMDSSPMRGLVIMYQCHDKNCLLIMSVSEQAQSFISPVPQQVLFNYRGEEVGGFVESISDGKSKNLIEYLTQLLKDNNIEIPGNVDYVPIIKKQYIGFNTNLDEINESINGNKEVAVDVKEEN